MRGAKEQGEEGEAEEEGEGRGRNASKLILNHELNQWFYESRGEDFRNHTHLRSQESNPLPSKRKKIHVENPRIVLNEITKTTLQ